MSIRDVTRGFSYCAAQAHAFHLRSNYCRAFALLSVNRNLLGEPDARDLDRDQVIDLYDNAYLMYNPLQRDSDHDGIADVEDSDIDGDGIANWLDTDPRDPGVGAFTWHTQTNRDFQTAPNMHAAFSRYIDKSFTGAAIDLLA
ncbi:MAG: thrombospondin type 3 repeat-containing protein [Phycisphaerae bacterium]